MSHHTPPPEDPQSLQLDENWQAVISVTVARAYTELCENGFFDTPQNQTSINNALVSIFGQTPNPLIEVIDELKNDHEIQLQEPEAYSPQEHAIHAGLLQEIHSYATQTDIENAYARAKTLSQFTIDDAPAPKTTDIFSASADEAADTALTQALRADEAAPKRTIAGIIPASILEQLSERANGISDSLANKMHGAERWIESLPSIWAAMNAKSAADKERIQRARRRHGEMRKDARGLDPDLERSYLSDNKRTTQAGRIMDGDFVRLILPVGIIGAGLLYALGSSFSDKQEAPAEPTQLSTPSVTNE